MFGRRNDGAEAKEALRQLEVRVGSLAAEVQSALQKLDRWEARETARLAAFAEATDKLHRTAERARKRRYDLAESGDSDSDGDDDAFYDLYAARRITPE